MTVTIDFAPEEEARLRQKAATAGKDIGKFIHDTALDAIDRPTLAQILAPVHEATRRAGVSVSDIDAMGEHALAEARSERRLGNPHG